MYNSIIKRAGDVIATLILLVFLSPIILVITLLLIIANEGEPFFLQKRPGKNGEIFSIIKFKSMNDDKDEHGNLLPPEKRITSIGKVIRDYSLDELMQLFNVLKGDMSIVGPRPLMIDYLKFYSDTQARRHEVRPGITGWAQVHGRNALTWQEKFDHDVWYVDHISFSTDMKILWKTVFKVLKREGVEYPLAPFRGNS